MYGNNVTLRPTSLERGARKAFVDFNFVLPDSRVIAFYIYANSSTVSVNDTFFRLQIWRPLDITVPRLQLVWQQQVQVMNTTHGLHSVSTHSALHTMICVV